MNRRSLLKGIMAAPLVALGLSTLPSPAVAEEVFVLASSAPLMHEVELYQWSSYSWGTYRPDAYGVEMLFDAAPPPRVDNA